MNYRVFMWNPVSAGLAMGSAMVMPAFDAASPEPSDFFALGSETTSRVAELGEPNTAFLLPPGKSRFYCGLLAQVPERGLILGTAAYLGGGHAAIAHAMREIFGHVDRFLWGGELMLDNPSRTLNVGTVTRINETSGFLQQARKDGAIVADDGLAEVQAALAATRAVLPFPVSRGLQCEHFKLEAPHLDARLNGLFGVKNKRHGVGDVISSIRIILSNKSVSESRSQLREFSGEYDNLLAICGIIGEIYPALVGSLNRLRPLDELLRLGDDEFRSAGREVERTMSMILELFNQPPGKPPIGAYNLFAIEVPG